MVVDLPIHITNMRMVLVLPVSGYIEVRGITCTHLANRSVYRRLRGNVISAPSAE